MNIQELFRKEKRDVLSIYNWLRAQGFQDHIIDQSIAEHAQRLADGERFGYTERGISILSNSIRDRCKEIREGQKTDLVNKFGDFKPTGGWLRAWFKRKENVG